MKRFGILTVIALALATSFPLYAQEKIGESPIIWMENTEDPTVKTMIFVTGNTGYKKKDGITIPDDSYSIKYVLFCTFGPEKFGPDGHLMRVITGVGNHDEPITGNISFKYAPKNNTQDTDNIRTFSYAGNYKYNGVALGGHQGYILFNDEVYTVLDSVAIAPQIFQEVNITLKGAAWERSFTYHPNAQPKAIEAMHKYCARK